MDLRNLIKKHIEKNVIHYFPHLSIKDTSIFVKPYRRFLITTPYSEGQFLVEVRIRQKNGREITKRIFAKKFRNAENEFRNWQKIKKVSFGPLKMIPQYYDLIREENILLSEYIHPAQNALYYFLKINIPFKNKDLSQKLMTKIANWLVNFQKQFTFSQPTSFESYILIAQRELETLPYFSSEEKKDIIYKIKKESVTISYLFPVFSGDLYLRHILMKDDKIIVVDWDNLKKTHPYYDIHALFINLESRTRHPLFFSKRYIAELEKKFLQTYQDLSNFEFSEKVYKLTRILYLIHFLYSYNWRYKNKIFHTKKMPFWRYFIYNIRKEIKGYLKDEL